MGRLGRSVAMEDHRRITHMDAAALGRLVRLRSRANASARSMRSRGAGRAAREAAEKEWAEARREADRLERGKPYEPQKPEAENPPSGAGKRKSGKPSVRGREAEKDVGEAKCRREGESLEERGCENLPSRDRVESRHSTTGENENIREDKPSEKASRGKEDYDGE